MYEESTMIELFRRLFRGGARPPGYDDLRFPFETMVVPGWEALRMRETLLGRAGVTPVIMGSRDDVRFIEDAMADSGASLQEILGKADRFDADAWMRSMAEAEPERFAAPWGEWPQGTVEPSDLALHMDVPGSRPKPHVIIGLVPTPNPWEVPAHLRYGGWGECPQPEVHVALHRRWHARFGATIACMSGDVIECVVERPPATRDEAYALAREQFAYCPDIVDQGMETVERLAATLLDGRTWFFWWD